MNTRFDNDLFMLTPDYDNSKWYYHGDGWWYIMHGTHHIKIDGDVFVNYHGDEPKVISPVDTVVQLTGEQIYALTCDCHVSLMVPDEWEELQYRLEIAADRIRARRFLLF